jgi:hypothetical protein
MSGRCTDGKSAFHDEGAMTSVVVNGKSVIYGRSVT